LVSDIGAVALCEIAVDIAGRRKTMAKSHLKLVAPSTVNRTVAPTRRPNAELWTREYLTDREVQKLQDAAKGNRWGHGDATMILVAYRHGLRGVSELTDLRWDQIDFNAGTMAVRRAKQGSPATHPIRGDELRALRKLQREQDPKSVRVHVGTWLAVHHGGLCAACRARG
jgi:integrase